MPGLSTEVVETILHPRASSMRKQYSLKKAVFTSWCMNHQLDPVNCLAVSVFSSCRSNSLPCNNLGAEGADSTACFNVMCSWPIVLLAFCPSPFRDLDQDTHNLVCPVRAMDTYVHRAALWSKTDPLFVCFGPPRKGFPATKQMLSRWLVKIISLTESSDLPSALGIRAHSM